MLSLFNSTLCAYKTHFKNKPAFAQDERDVSGKVVIVTGANHGIGKQTALQMAKRRALVIMACRDLGKAEQAKKDILRKLPTAKLEILKLDLGDLSAIRAFSGEVHSKYTHIDILINNAGIYNFDAKKSSKLKKTKDGFEEHIGVNHLGTFLLTLLLLDLLQKAENSRVVVLSSCMSLLSKLDVNNLQCENMKNFGFNNSMPYNNSKMANILFVHELARRLGENPNIRVYANCPGVVYVDNLKDENIIKRQGIKFAHSFMLFDLDDGCLSTLYCALSKTAGNETGKFYRALEVSTELDDKTDDKQAQDLWTLSEELVGEKFQMPEQRT